MATDAPPIAPVDFGAQDSNKRLSPPPVWKYVIILSSDQADLMVGEEWVRIKRGQTRDGSGIQGKAAGCHNGAEHQTDANRLPRTGCGPMTDVQTLCCAPAKTITAMDGQVSWVRRKGA